LKTIFEYIPCQSHKLIKLYIDKYPVRFKISDRRFSKHGDYRLYFGGEEQISINSNLNPYKFLITLVHEISHLVSYRIYGRKIKPHGIEWKKTYKNLIYPFLNNKIFPEELLNVLKNHFVNPRSSTDSDIELALALKKYDNFKELCLYQISEGAVFKIYNGRVFKKGPIKRKRIECEELKSKKLYLFSPLAEISLIQS
tara:strand:- start:550 stop:1143 length:594 start_codon:yes stop_codon:yes gene_type:complete